MTGIAVGSNRYATMAEQLTATIDASDTYLENQTIVRKMANALSAAGMFIAISVPNPVAALLPPRQLRKMDLLWPTIARIAAATGSHGPNGEFAISGTQPCLSARMATRTGTYPLATSTTNTKAAAPLPAIRNTLVVPVLPLPIFVRSTCFNALTTQ